MIQNGVKPKISKVKLQKADILKTHGDNKKLFKYIGHKNSIIGEFQLKSYHMV